MSIITPRHNREVGRVRSEKEKESLLFFPPTTPEEERTPSTLPPPPSRLRAGSHTRFSSTGSRFRSSRRPSRSHTTQSRSDFIDNRTSSPLQWLRTVYRDRVSRSSGRKTCDLVQVWALVQTHDVTWRDTDPPQGDETQHSDMTQHSVMRYHCSRPVTSYYGSRTQYTPCGLRVPTE